MHTGEEMCASSTGLGYWNGGGQHTTTAATRDRRLQWRRVQRFSIGACGGRFTVHLVPNVSGSGRWRGRTIKTKKKEDRGNKMLRRQGSSRSRPTAAGTIVRLFISAIADVTSAVSRAPLSPQPQHANTHTHTPILYIYIITTSIFMSHSLIPQFSLFLSN